MQTYHMRRQDREIKDPSLLSDVLQQGKFIVLALSHLDVPYIVTLNYGYDHAQNTVYFHCAKEGLKLQYIDSNPKVCATVILDKGYIQSECAHPFTTVVIRGVIERVDDTAVKKHGMMTILNHLESNPTTIAEQKLHNDKIYDDICILKMVIKDISGKTGR